MDKIDRPSWDEYFFEIADIVAKRATCMRRKVGAVIVKNKQVLASGYNGPPSGVRHCQETGCIREQMNIPSGERHELCRGLHAEQNAIIQAALHGTSIDGSVLYCTHQPCVICAKMIINAGIQAVKYKEGYPDEMSEEFFREADIKLMKCSDIQRSSDEK